jgi:protein-tyrosine phosphatase
VKRLYDPLLHPLRRSRARRALVRASPIRSVLLVCHGNICRSPYAAARLVRELTRVTAEIKVASAGFVGSDRPSPPAARAVAARRGVSLTEHRSLPIDGITLANADLVVVMEPEQARALTSRFGRLRGTLLVLGDLDPRPIRARGIQDPVHRDEAVFEESYERIDRCVVALIDALFADRTDRVSPIA